MDILTENSDRIGSGRSHHSPIQSASRHPCV